MSFTHFHAFYSVQAFEAFCHNLIIYRACTEEDSQRQAKIDAWLDSVKVFDVSLLNFILHKSQTVTLAKIPYTQGRRIAWADTWNHMVQGIVLEQSLLEELTSGTGLHLLSSMLPTLLSPSSAALAHNQLCTVVELGDFHSMGERSTCDLTGEQLGITMKSWEPRLFCMKTNVSGQRVRQEIAADGPQLNTVQLSIPAPSGRILLADWFRINEFTTVVKNHATAPSINSAFGRVTATRRYAEEFGFISIAVGEENPCVIQRAGHIVIAQCSTEPLEHGHLIGTICTDLWWATAIDFSTLVSIVARIRGASEATRVVNAYLDSYSSEIIEVRVPPGSTLYFSFQDENTLRTHFCDEVLTQGLSCLHAVLSTQPLRWKTPDCLLVKTQHDSESARG